MNNTMADQVGDMKVSIPELVQAFHELIGAHSICIRSLASRLGDDDPLIMELDKGWGAIMIAAMRANMLSTFTMQSKESQSVSTPHDVRSVTSQQNMKLQKTDVQFARNVQISKNTAVQRAGDTQISPLLSPMFSLEALNQVQQMHSLQQQTFTLSL